ncbi:hypothetical protein NDU88_008601 [Pleurodeles waltl]|uniref:OTU domain-containing protein 3 n=1 Tax=Pleurodeles waltl TaxID=8319 RepID=A0AAV7QP75_PLEWA|nr:hypothetical protein NDU88_008601 [Pleurodeles waltl]
MSRRQAAGARARPGDRKKEEWAARRAKAKEKHNQDPEEQRGLNGQLRARGLRIREVPGDGNCLFRALGDQLEGHSRNHLKHRQETVNYMIKHRQDFEPFVEDDVPFDRHVANLEKPGTFAGNDAIVAFARNHQLQVVIHQLNNPLWQVRGTDKPGAQELHIVYRYGEHYDSVRRLNDNSETPAYLQTQMLCNDDLNWNERNQLQSLGNETEDWGDEGCQQELDDAVHKVRNATGCSDINLILQNLEAESYDVESAVFAILQTEELSRIDADVESVKQQDPSLSPSSPASCEDGVKGSGNFSNQGNGQNKVDNQLMKQKSQEHRDGNARPVDPLVSHSEENAAARNRHQKLSNKQRKEQQRQEKKRRQEERHRQKVSESRRNNVDNNKSEMPSEGQVTLVKTFSALTI